MSGAHAIEDVNIANALTATARRIPTAAAVMHPLGRKDGKQRYAEIRYRDLDEDSARIARGLRAIGLTAGTRVALMVRPGADFFGLAFGLFRAGVVPILIDPGIGLSALKTCLGEAAPEAFIGIPQAHAARIALGWARGSLRHLITVGTSWGWGGFSLDEVRRRGERETAALPEVAEGDLAAIIFTSGSTGIPKGVCYTHGNFAAQVAMIRSTYKIEPGEIDLPTFPLFALFDPALGMTTVIPAMDFTKPASVDPNEIIEPIRHFQITNMFGSPALLNTVGRWSDGKGIQLPSLKRVISAGAAVPATVQERFAKMLSPQARIVTPYGATEGLPVASIDHVEVLSETRAATEVGAGVCVGKPITGVRVEVIRINDDPIADWSEDLRAKPGNRGKSSSPGRT